MKDYLSLINEEMEHLDKLFIGLFNADNDVLKKLLEFINNGSKRIRSTLGLLYLKANNVSIDDNMLKLLLTCELIHNASLLHDDVIDNSEFRRGEQTLWKTFDKKTSVMCGDYLLSFAVEQLLGINNTEILRYYLDATKQMSNAEILQFVQRGKAISLDCYIEIVSGKTAALFQAMFKSIAIIANLNADTADLLGKLYGILFQINNDCKKDSIQNDRMNQITTVINILGIEKTNALKDNYKQDIREIIKSFPSNQYCSALEDIISRL